jgi:hypothetical protein
MTDRYACWGCGETYTDENIEACDKCGRMMCAGCGALFKGKYGERRWLCAPPSVCSEGKEPYDLRAAYNR